MGISELRRKKGVSQATYFNWTSRYGGMEAADNSKL
jgi:putative transposase